MNDAKWIFKDSSGKVSDVIDLGTIDPGESGSVTISAEFSFIRKVIVLGFYLEPSLPNQYIGDSNPGRDVLEILRWADKYTVEGDLPPGLPGLELSQYSSSEEGTVTLQFKSGQGDSSGYPLPFLGTANQQLGQDQRVSISLTINIPSAEAKQIVSAGIFNFNLAIAYRELNG